MAISGIVSSAAYLGGAFLLQADPDATVPVAEQYPVGQRDKLRLILYVAAEFFFGLAFFEYGKRPADYAAGSLIAGLMVASNFIVALVAWFVIPPREKPPVPAKGPGRGDRLKMMKGMEKDWGKAIAQSKYWLLFLANLVFSGVASMLTDRFKEVSFADENQMNHGAFQSADTDFWIADFVGRLGGGVLVGFLANYISSYLWALLFGASVTAGAGVVAMLPSIGIGGMHWAAFLGGFGFGGLWTVVPLIMVEDNGRNNFGSIWGTQTTGITIGTYLFSRRLFDHFYDKVENNRFDYCQGAECY